MTPKDILTNDAFCPIPWTGLMYNFDGTVKNCIRSAETLGNIKHNTIEEIVLGHNNDTRQSMMLDKIKPTNCSPCYNLEIDKTGFDIISDRIFYIRELKNTPLDVYRPNNFNLKTIDIRWTNLCNFACVYCNPMFSSKWADETKTILSTPIEQQRNKFKEYILKHAGQLKHVYLAGGEPLLMKENLELLELLQQVNPDVNLRINTNLSKTDTRVFDRVCEFKNVHWTVSIETIEDEFEYIRYGGNWADFLENLSRIKNLNHKISFNMLWFLLNYESVFGCVDYLKNLGFHNNSFVIGALLDPEYLNVRHLPENVLNLIKIKLKSNINSAPGYLLEDSYRNLLSYVEQPFEKDLAGSFEKIKILDQRRNIDSSKIFKELYKLKEGN
jgi:sulfatase maturation enzyme AslB (radical SAM superfamily)